MTGFFEQLNQSLGGTPQNKDYNKQGFFEQISETMPDQPKDPGFGEIALDVGKQLALGIPEKLTWPLQALKSTLHAFVEGESDEDESLQQGLDPLKKLLEYFPTQEMAEKFITKQTGIDLTPQTPQGKSARFFSQLFSLQPGKLIPGTVKELGKKTAGSATGVATSKGLQELGLPESVSDLIGAGTAGIVTAGKSSPKVLSNEAQQIDSIANKHDLRKFAGMESSKTPKVTPIVTAERQKALRDSLDESSVKAINQVLDQKLPIKTLRDSGIDLKDAYTKVYNKNLNEAKKFDFENARNKRLNKPTKEVKIDNILDHIQNEIKKINRSAPSLSKPDKIRKKILQDEYKALSNEPKPLSEILDSQGKKITQSVTARTPKKVTMEQMIDQKINYNENVNGIYRKPEFTGAEEIVRQTYADLNDQVRKSISKADPKIGFDLKTADAIFSETSNLRQVDNILKKAFEDGYNYKSLNKILSSNRNQKFLERSIGKEGISDLREIGKYGEKAEKLIFDRIKEPGNFKDYLSNLTPLKLALLIPKGTVLLPLTISKEIAQRTQGYLFTRNSTRKSYMNYLKAAGSGKPALITNAAKVLDQAIHDEFGSEQELLKMAQDFED